jgi:hypothetical protein
MFSTDFNGYGFNGMYFMLAQVAFIENIQVLFIVVVARSQDSIH